MILILLFVQTHSKHSTSKFIHTLHASYLQSNSPDFWS